MLSGPLQLRALRRPPLSPHSKSAPAYMYMELIIIFHIDGNISTALSVIIIAKIYPDILERYIIHGDATLAIIFFKD